MKNWYRKISAESDADEQTTLLTRRYGVARMLLNSDD
jgi:hypothetical protein